MTVMLTDLETLAERMRLLTGGVALLSWADQSPRVLVRVGGGFRLERGVDAPALESGSEPLLSQ